MSIDYNCDEALGEHTVNDCGIERQGGASVVVLGEYGSTLTDPSSSVEILAAIAAGTATKIEGVNISYDRASAIEIDSIIPGEPARVVNYDRAGVLRDGNVSAANNTFYDGIFNGRKFGWVLILENGNEGDQKAHYIEGVVTFTGSNRLPNTQSEFQDYEGSFKWKKLTMPSLHAIPVI